jgi:hypothetical protein
MNRFIQARPRSKKVLLGDAVNPAARLSLRSPRCAIPGGFWKNVPVFQAPQKDFFRTCPRTCLRVVIPDGAHAHFPRWPIRRLSHDSVAQSPGRRLGRRPQNDVFRSGPHTGLRAVIPDRAHATSLCIKSVSAVRHRCRSSPPPSRHNPTLLPAVPPSKVGDMKGLGHEGLGR